MQNKEEYFKRFMEYEDDTNMYHPNQIDKNENTEFIKIAYRLLHNSVDFHTKNMAKNYLGCINNKNGEKRKS